MTVVIASAIVPTMIAQTLFKPESKCGGLRDRFPGDTRQEGRAVDQASSLTSRAKFMLATDERLESETYHVQQNPSSHRRFPGQRKVLAAAVDLATHYQAELIALSVAEMPEVVAMVDEVDELRQSADDYFRQIGEAAVEYARSRGVTLRHVVVRGHAADEIIRFAEKEEINLIVLGRQGHSRSPGSSWAAPRIA